MLLNDMHEDWDAADEDLRDAIVTLNTDGKGYWTNRALPVRITELSVPYISEDGDFGELKVHYNTADWRCDKLGLIYTDRLFMKQLQAFCTSIGLAGDDVSYSEQGMQGDNYVSCDIGKYFLGSWKVKYPEKYKEAHNENN